MKKEFKCLWLFFSLILFVILFFLLKETFFFHDEWVFLHRLIKSPSEFIFTQHNGHFMPVFNTIYLIEYKLFKLNYTFYQFILLIFHFTNAYLLSVIINKVTKNKYFAFLSFFLFITSSMYWEILFSSSTFLNVLYLFFVELSIVYYLNFNVNNKLKYLMVSNLFILIAIFTWGGGFVYPFTFLGIILFKKILKEKVLIQELIMSLANSLISVFIFFFFVKQSPEKIDIGRIIIFMFDSIKWLVVSFYTSSPGLLRVFAVLIIITTVLLHNVIFNKKLRNQFLSNLKDSRILLFFSIFNFLLLYLITSISRYSFGSELAKSSRYTYAPLFFFVIINLIIFSSIYPLVLKKTKLVFSGYLLLLFLGNIYFFKIYYSSWINTISIPHKQTYQSIISSCSNKDLNDIKFSDNFTFLKPEDICNIYKQSVQ